MSRKGLTTSQLFGLSPEERTALINTVAGEAYQGGQGRDIAAVTANLLSRRLANYGGNTNMVDLVMQPQQYEANFELTRDQIKNPGLIGRIDRERIGKIVDNPSMVLAEYQAGGGPLSFRGTANYKYRRGDEYTPVEGKSNFYFDGLKQQNPEAFERGLQMFSGVTPSSYSANEQTPTQTAAAATTTSTTLPDGTVINVNIGKGQTDPKTPKFDPNDFMKRFLIEQIQGAGNTGGDLVNNLIKQASSGGYISAKQAMNLFGGFE